MGALHRNLRANIRDTAYLFSSEKSAQQFQLQVPHVFAPTELFCKWFDDSYLPQNPDFIAAFSVSELQVISEFNSILSKLSNEVGDPPPSLEVLFKLPTWQEVNKNADKLLKTIYA